MRAITALTVVCLLGMRLHAATVTWTNGNGNGLWGTPANWSTNAVPGVADAVIFDNTSAANCNVNVNANVQGLSIMGSYSGTLTQQAGISITIGTGGYTQNGATFQGGTTSITINNGGFTLNGGVFTSTSGNLSLSGARTASSTLFNHVGGTFNHNNGTLLVAPTCNVGSQLTFTLDVLPFTVFYNVTINTAFGWVMPLVATATGDVVNATNDLTHSDGYIIGQFAVKNNLYIGAGSDGGTGTITVDGTGAQQYSTAAGTARTCQVVVNKSAGAFTPMVGTTDFYMQSFSLLAGDFTAPSGNMNVGGTWTTSQTLFNHGGGTFTHNNGTLVVNPYCSVGTQLTWTLDVLPTTALYNVTINSGYGWVMPLVATATGDVVNATNDLTHTDGYIIGQFAVKNNLYLGAGSDGGTGTITVDGTGAQQYSTAAGAARTCQVVVNKSAGAFTPMVGTTDFYMQSFSLLAGDFTAPSGNMNVGGTWTTSQTLFNHGGGTFTHNNGTLVVNPYCSVGTQLTWTLDVLPTTALYNVTINSGYGWVMPLVATATGDVVNATNDLTHTDGYIIGQFAVKNNLYLGAGSDGGTGTITVDGTGAQQYSTTAGAARTCQVVVNKSAGAFTPMVGTTDFYMQSFSLLAGDFTAPSGNMNVGGTWTTSQTLFNHGGGTFTHNNGTLVVNPYCSVGTQLTWTLDVLPTTALYNVTINSGYGWVMPLVATATGDVVNATNDLTHTDGYIIGQFAVKNNLYLGAGSDGGTGTITVDGTGAQQYSTAAGAARTCQVVVNKSAGAFTPMAGTTDFYMQSFSLLAGAFTAPSGNMNVGGTWTTSQTLFNHGGGTFTHNNGTVVVNPYCSVGSQLTWTIDVLPTTALYNVTINSGYGWVMPLVATATGDVVNATNDLTHTDGYIIGQFAVKNNLYLGAGSDGGTGTITVDGTGAQQYSTAAGAARTCQVVVNKSAGSFTPMAGTTDFYMQSFSLLAGAFTAPSGNMNVGGTWTTSQTLFNHGGGTFTHNNGTLVVNPYCSVGTQLTWTIDVLPTTALYNVTINSGYGWVMPLVATATGDVVNATNDLTHTDGYIIGQFAVKNNLYLGAGSDGGTGTITADGTGAQQYSTAAGAARTCRVVVNKSAGSFTPMAGTTDFYMQSFSLLAGDFTAPSGNMNVGGTWTTSQTLFNHGGGTFTHNNGTLVIDPYCSVGSQLTWTIDVLPSTDFYNVTVNSGYGWVMPLVATAVADTVNATNDLTHSDGFITGLFEVKRNLIINAGSDGGTGTIVADGTGAQEYQIASGSPRTCKLVVNKSGGALTPASGTTDLLVQAFSLLAGDFTAPTENLNVGGTWTTSQTLFNHSGGTFAHNSGTLVVNPYTSVGSALTFTLDVIPATTFNQVTININTGWVLPQCTIPASDSLHIDGTLLLSDGRVSTGTFEAYGDVTVSSGYDGGNALLLFTGGNEQNFDLTGATGNYDGGIKLNKSAAQVTLLSNLLMDAASQTLRLQQGILNTSASTLLIIGDNVTTSGASNSSFVDGPMRKVGNDAFTFPVGDLGLYHAPLTITAPGSTSDAFTLEYIHLDPQTVPYDVTSLGAGINHVSRCEYWDLLRTAGSSNVRVTLSWDTRSCGVDQLSTMRVARWNGTQWVSHGNGGTTGSTSAGTLITAAGSTPTAYGPFTLSSSTSNNPLPIELLSFTAEPDGQVVDLAWVTATEQDNDRFVVERSGDAAVFQAVLETAGAGNSSSTLHYSGVDPRPLDGLSYYRLKQIDLDGAFSYSNVVAVQRPTYQGDAHVVLYPNPSTGELNVRIPGAAEQALVVQLFDATGRLMLEQRTATSVLHIDASALPPGTYRVVAMDGDRWSGTTSWVKQ